MRWGSETARPDRTAEMTTPDEAPGRCKSDPALALPQPEKLAPSELWTVELALDLAGWKPALLDGRGPDAFL